MRDFFNLVKNGSSSGRQWRSMRMYGHRTDEGVLIGRKQCLTVEGGIFRTGAQSSGALKGLHRDGVPPGMTTPYCSSSPGKGKSVLMK